MLNTFTGSPRSSPPAEEWYLCRICWYQRALAFSPSLIPGVTAAATNSFMLRKLFRPTESQGSTTSVWPTFSIRTARFDCQLCSMAPSRFIPQPIGDRQFAPSIVPPCTTMYLCSPVVRFSTWLFGTSDGWVFEAQGSSAGGSAAFTAKQNRNAQDLRSNCRGRVFIGGSWRCSLHEITNGARPNY